MPYKLEISIFSFLKDPYKIQKYFQITYTHNTDWHINVQTAEARSMTSYKSGKLSVSKQSYSQFALTNHLNYCF